MTASLVRDRYDETAVEIVCVERVPMRLRGVDRIEAVRRLSAKGLQPYEIARLVHTNANHVSALQRQNDIEPAPRDAGWRCGLSNRERLKRNERQRLARVKRTAARKAGRDK